MKREPGATPDGWTEREWRALQAAADTFAPGPAALSAGMPGAIGLRVADDAARAIDAMSPETSRDFHRLLATIESPSLNALLGHLPRRFSRRAPEERERYLLRWSRSPLGVKRRGFYGLKRLLLFLYYTSLRPDGSTTARTVPGYELPPPAPKGGSGSPIADFVPAPGAEIQTDAAIVGSGAGGAVIAARLSQAGFRVVVVEAGENFGGPDYPRSEREAYARLFLAQGRLTTSDFAINLLAGEVAGGSTTVNWMTCLRPPSEVRAEWEAAGLAHASGAPFDTRFDAVESRINVTSDESQRNGPNEALARGCRALGYNEGTDYELIRRNARGCRERCGGCAFGCPFDAKQSAVVTYLRDAGEHGARFLFRTHADRIMVEGDGAKGLECTSRQGPRPFPVTVRARVVVAAGGALQTPALLRRSGIRFPGVGFGLRLHPTTAVVGEYAKPVPSWVGPPQTVAVRKFQATDPPLHGPWIEVAPAHPGIAAQALAWNGANAHYERMQRLGHAVPAIVLVRDTGEGQVEAGSDGRARVSYSLTPRDRKNLARGIVEAARIHHAAGAVRIATLHQDGLEVGNGRDPVTTTDLEALRDEVSERGIRENQIALYSAHPVGSARVGANPSTSATTRSGEVHGVPNLWVGDGSLLPTAPGVNPMVSIMAVASYVADAIALRLANGGASVRKAL